MVKKALNKQKIEETLLRSDLTHSLKFLDPPCNWISSGYETCNHYNRRKKSPYGYIHR